MKRYFFTLIILLASCSLWAVTDQLTLAGCELAPKDLTARVKPVNDMNGDPCAMLRIQVPLLEKLDVKGAMTIEHQPGEFLVYVPTSVRRVQVLHSDFVPLTIDFDALNIELEAKRVYRVRLQLPPVYYTGTRMVATSQYLTFNVEPSTATIQVNGQDWVENSRYVPFGTYEYVISAYGYRPDTGTVVVESTEEPKVLNISLHSIFGYLNIVDPSGKYNEARVHVDGVQRGVLPLDSIVLSPGQHEVVIRKALYRPMTRVVTINESQTTILTPTLDADFSRVTLTVDKDPEAEIYIDNRMVGRGSWTGDVQVGGHLIRVARANCRPREREIVIVDTEPVTYTLQAPIPIYGILSVTSVPSGADIYIDGEDMHQQTPHVFSNLYVGSHRLMLRYENADDYVTDVVLREGEENQHMGMLNPRRKVQFKMRKPESLTGVTLYENGKLRARALHLPATFLLDANACEIRFEAEGYYPLVDTIRPNQDQVMLTFKPLPTQRQRNRIEYYNFVGNVRVNWFALTAGAATGLSFDASLVNVRYRWIELMPLQFGASAPLFSIEDKKFSFPKESTRWSICYEPELRLHTAAARHVDWFLGVGGMIPLSTLLNRDALKFASALPMLEGTTRPYWFLADVGFQKTGKVGAFQMFVRYNGNVQLCFGFALGTGFCRPPLPEFMLEFGK